MFGVVYNFETVLSLDQEFVADHLTPAASFLYLLTLSVNKSVKHIRTKTPLAFKHQKASQEAALQQETVPADPTAFPYIRGKCRHSLFFVEHYWSNSVSGLSQVFGEVRHSAWPSSVSLNSVFFLAASFIMDSSLGCCHQESINDWKASYGSQRLQ